MCCTAELYTDRALVIENYNRYYEDDGALTTELCEEDGQDNTQEAHLSSSPHECCVCDEAKYEITFEGIWSRNTHPKDFPESMLLEFLRFLFM